MDMMDGETQVTDYALERVIMLSDGVFAIAMTLMAFDLRPSGTWDHTIPGLIRDIRAPFTAFFWSFVTTGSFWLTHRRLFGQYRRADGPISVINLILLAEIVLIPVATQVLTRMEYSRGSLELYLGLFGLVGLTNAASWLYATLLTDIVHRPRAGVVMVLSVGGIYAVVPVAVAALGICSAFPGDRWLLALMPLVIGGASMLRRFCERVSRPALPVRPVAGQVTARPG